MRQQFNMFGTEIKYKQSLALSNHKLWEVLTCIFEDFTYVELMH